MGLDNIPEPRPCVIRGYAVRDSEGRIDCEKTNCPFKMVKHGIGIFATYCWIRGGLYDHVLGPATDYEYSFYDELTLDDLKIIMEKVRGYKPIDDFDAELKEHLVEYLETLLKEVGDYKEFKLVPWW